MADIPRFLPSSSSEASRPWPWANCEPGETDVQSKYALLAKLQIPLGTRAVDVNCRAMILRHLISFNEKVMKSGNKHSYVMDNGRSASLLRVSPLASATAMSAGGRKTGRVVDSFLECLGERTSASEAADAVCLHLAKYYPTAFAPPVVALAQKRQATKEDVPPRRTYPVDMILYDESSPEWSWRYGQLVDYHALHGDCRVQTRLPPEHANEKLGKWVQSQRQLYKHGNMAAVRVELLNSLTFCWNASNGENRTDDPRMHKAVAAKLAFPHVTAREAMLLSGFPPDFCDHDSRKKHVNQMANGFYKTEMKCKAAVLQLLERLPHGVLDVYGDSATLSTLLAQGKLVVVPAADDDETAAARKKPRTMAPPAYKEAW